MKLPDEVAAAVERVQHLFQGDGYRTRGEIEDDWREQASKLVAVCRLNGTEYEIPLPGVWDQLRIDQVAADLSAGKIDDLQAIGEYKATLDLGLEARRAFAAHDPLPDPPARGSNAWQQRVDRALLELNVLGADEWFSAFWSVMQGLHDEKKKELAQVSARSSRTFALLLRSYTSTPGSDGERSTVSEG